jgi:hypothetical protein
LHYRTRLPAQDHLRDGYLQAGLQPHYCLCKRPFMYDVGQRVRLLPELMIETTRGDYP